MPPQVNARLTRIAGAGTADDWDRAGAAGAEKWAGDADAYYREKVDRTQGSEAVDAFVRRTLWVDTPDVPDVLDTDDVVTIVRSSGATIVATVKAIARAESLDARTAPVATARIELEDG